MLVTFDGETFEDADPGNWRLSLFDSNGTELVHNVTLKSEVPDVGSCDEDGCRKTGFAVVPVPAPWQPGIYTIRSLFALDTRMESRMTIALEGSAPSIAQQQAAEKPTQTLTGPAVFIATREPVHPWPVADASTFTLKCVEGLESRYGRARTPAQIRYACECITWGLEDRYSENDVVAASSSNPQSYSAVVKEISTSCKTKRPALLGPDPEPIP